MDNKIEVDYDVVIIGAGISGINAAYRVKTQCPTNSWAIFEARDAIGGTWDLFKYPGIRSDSDLHTFGFPWRPWTEQKAIADGASIAKYIRETAAAEGIDKKIHFKHKLSEMDWSSKTNTWTLDVDVDGVQKEYTARYVIMASGYYDYNEPLQASIPGLDNFKGTIIHPQFWPSDLDYADKNMVVIGSGATAVTLLPNLGEKAKHVTMLQRSPGYLLSLPSVSPLDTLIRAVLPQSWSHVLIRMRFLVIGYLFFQFCRAFPSAARKVVKAATVKQLPKNVPHDPHFEPSYNPWEQRLCICPDGDFYKSLHEGKCSVSTGHIRTITADTIELESGETIPADIIVTATGLKIQLAGGAKLSVDGNRINIGDKFLWKGVMLQDLPNAALVMGYTNASWTLGADATAQLVTRLINHMRVNNMAACVPRLEDEGSLKACPTLNLNSTYVKKAAGMMPKAGDKGPWQARKSYFSDVWNAKFGDVETGLQFYRF
ncbi:FAD/NAD(P)-binding domain-containing protein [Saccharata proteae CBS 121410]|uniref:FAD/NAD(P)-binding domain-containing protein n=1 Tax=Saccharata proteae CBS 121410 TaxID=1314787 RepID=A0A9P4LWZ9_9PEZI|nr:FAD/NAD(P)-binding domain-containing protein [Saccharata proteae CBS 121410]